MNRRRLWCSLVLLAGLAGVLACGGGDEAPAQPVGEAPKPGGTLVIGSISDVDSWNEYISQQSFANFLLRRVYLRLAEQKPGPLSHPNDYEPSLAESWEASKDGLSLTFRLREVSWSDGTPIGAEDVRFTWQAQTSEHVPWIGAASKTRIRDVEVVDARTIRFHFDAVYPYQFLDAIEGGILPKHVFGEIPFERWKDHDWLSAKVGYDSDPDSVDPSKLQKVGKDPAHLVDRGCKTDPLGRLDDSGIHPDNLSVNVDERTARIPRVD